MLQSLLSDHTDTIQTTTVSSINRVNKAQSSPRSGLMHTIFMLQLCTCSTASVIKCIFLGKAVNHLVVGQNKMQRGILIFIQTPQCYKILLEFLLRVIYVSMVAIEYKDQNNIHNQFWYVHNIQTTLQDLLTQWKYKIL